MIRSIRHFLLISLLLSITIASAINGIGNYLLDEKVIEPYLDGQLIRVSSIISIVSKSEINTPALKDEIINYLRQVQPITKQIFVFQVFNKNGELLINSSPSFTASLKNVASGFSDHTIDGRHWRIYCTINNKTGIKVAIAELHTLRSALADEIAHINANILLISYPVFGLLVWLIINISLRSVTSVTKEIKNRASTYLEPVQLTKIPDEIKPLVQELNQLFMRLKLAFERNKRFSADAAHELRTPLAALKTHLQVALKSDNESDKKKAFQRVLESVDRSSHVVGQLLTLSRIGEEETLIDVKAVDLRKTTTEMVAYLAPHALEKNIDLEFSCDFKETFILGNEIAIGIMIRNIVDNAIRYTPQNGTIKIKITKDRESIILCVIDSGSGIPIELRERVFERFYRILGTKASGSGLGLAIVSQIALLHHASILLSVPPNGIGLQFEVAFPTYHA